MSMYFDIGETTLWNPSNGAGRLFLRHAGALEAELGLPSGIRQGEDAGDPDTVVLDRAVYAEPLTRRSLPAGPKGATRLIVGAPPPGSGSGSAGTASARRSAGWTVSARWPRAVR
ncbi:DUF6086 family protein [Streptomyces sp. NBC_01358]|uniref:DUF6086 family protein n=1 Tax=Streptomyces sp. NBC_01358 TaxID=2903837 RepID=UPI002E34F4B7|nr:DUF6086 family protein [Streptomyces sp. NBC_01358]